MKDFNSNAVWNKEVAAHYDTHLRGDEEAAAAFLAGYAPGGSALEFAIGTGRIALPLLERGLDIDGIELSPDMVDQLHSKPRGREIQVTVGDMSVVSTNRQYDLVYLVYNTIFNLLTATAQIRCFENAARHLAADGRFVVEAALPHVWMPTGAADYVHAEHVGLAEVVLDVARYDPVSQLLEENHVHLTANGISLKPIVCRLITPGEMDLMARIAGLRLVERFGNWQRSPFDATSQAHVSVYGPAQAGH